MLGLSPHHMPKPWTSGPPRPAKPWTSGPPQPAKRRHRAYLACQHLQAVDEWAVLPDWGRAVPSHLLRGHTPYYLQARAAGQGTASCVEIQAACAVMSYSLAPEMMGVLTMLPNKKCMPPGTSKTTTPM